MNDWIKIARDRWITAALKGNGRYAVVSECGTPGVVNAVQLCITEDLARATAHGACSKADKCHGDHRVVVLKSSVPSLRDDYEDRQWEKRFDREHKQVPKFR